MKVARLLELLAGCDPDADVPVLAVATATALQNRARLHSQSDVVLLVGDRHAASPSDFGCEVCGIDPVPPFSDGHANEVAEALGIILCERCAKHLVRASELVARTEPVNESETSGA